MKVLDEYVIIEHVEEDAVSNGGIVLSEKPKGVLPLGIVKYVGDKAEGVSPGDKIILTRLGPKTIIKGQDLHVVTIKDIIGVKDD